MKSFRSLFYWFVPPKDWYPVWTKKAEWNVDGKFSNNCSFEILYSPYRGMYRLKTYGENPVKHSVYREAVNNLNDFIQSEINNEAAKLIIKN